MIISRLNARPALAQLCREDILPLSTARSEVSPNSPSAVGTPHPCGYLGLSDMVGLSPVPLSRSRASALEIGSSEVVDQDTDPNTTIGRVTG